MTKEEAINWFVSKLMVNDRFGLHGLRDEAAKVALAALREQVEAEKPLTVDELRKAQQGEWLWINHIGGGYVCYYESGYYRIGKDWTHGDSLCCDYPEIGIAFDYCDYNEGWLAYRRKPKDGD